MTMLLVNLWVWLVLPGALLVAPPPQAAVAIGLLLAQAFRWTWPGKPHLRLAVSLLTLLLLPVVLHPVLDLQLPGGNEALLFLPGFSDALTFNGLSAAAAALPVLVSITADLKLMNLAAQRRPRPAVYRGLSGTAGVLGITGLMSILISVIAGNPPLLAITTIALLLLVTAVYRGYRNLGGEALRFSDISGVRIMAGKPEAVKLTLQLATRNHIPLVCRIQPEHSWIRLDDGLVPVREITDLRVTLQTPPLAGFFQPDFNLIITDPAGLVVRQQVARPLKIEVIPRAAYARMLATRYLSGGGSGFGGSGVLYLSSFKKAGRGLDYLGSRQYQAGDRLKEIDWKHSAKFQSVVSKEYARGAGSSAAILACLDAADAAAGDKLAFHLISSALTLAQEAIPTAVLLYNGEEIVKYTPAGSPDGVLRDMLGMIKHIRVRPAMKRRLSPVDVTTLRRSIKLLQRVAGEETSGLLTLLDFEKEALRHAATAHPLIRGIGRLCRDLSRPAAVIVISGAGDDLEASAWVLETLKLRGYELIKPVESHV